MRFSSSTLWQSHHWRSILHTTNNWKHYTLSPATSWWKLTQHNTVLSSLAENIRRVWSSHRHTWSFWHTHTHTHTDTHRNKTLTESDNRNRCLACHRYFSRWALYYSERLDTKTTPCFSAWQVRLGKEDKRASVFRMPVVLSELGLCVCWLSAGCATVTMNSTDREP